MWGLTILALFITTNIAIITLGLLISERCIKIEDIKEFIIWLDKRADDRKKNRQGRSKFYDKNSRY